MISFLKEFIEFLKVRKKFWLIPIVVFLVLIGVIVVGGQSSPVTLPFIYAIF
mgnify:CR=1|tara:strand:- start:628 stop:783 length:156 start_codon:yes stop_codon:yes gene_type:complete